MTSGSAQEAGVKLPPSSFLRVQNIKGGGSHRHQSLRGGGVCECVSGASQGSSVEDLSPLDSGLDRHTEQSTGVSREEG